MKKILCLFLAVCLLMMHVTALAEEEILPGAGVVIGQPDGMNILASYTTADGFHKPEGSTPWSFERATPNTDEYQNLTYYGNDVSGGWFDQEYLDWVHGAVHYPVAMHPGVLGDAIVAFTAPTDGTLMIHSSVAQNLGASSDGVLLKITKNSEPVYPAEGWLTLEPLGQISLPTLTFSVKSGDVIRFRANCNKNQSNDGFHWIKTVSYLGEVTGAKPAFGIQTPVFESLTVESITHATDAWTSNEGTGWTYQNAAVGTNDYTDLERIRTGWYNSFYMNWKAGAIPYKGVLNAGEAGDPTYTYTCPKDGILVLPSSVAKCNDNAGKGDGSNVSILKNDSPIYPDVGALYVATFSEVTIPTLLFPVQAGDKIHFRANCNASQTSDSTRWDPAVCYLDGKWELPDVGDFSDVPQDYWAYDAIVALCKRGLMGASADGLFAPAQPMSRGEFVMLVQRAAGIPNVPHKDYFSDLAIGQGMTNSVNAAYTFDLLPDEMVVNRKFLPDQTILMEEALSILVYALQNTEYRVLPTASVVSVTTPSSWAELPLSQASGLGWVGVGFDAQKGLTRADAAILTEAFLKTVETPWTEGAVSATYQQPYYKKTDIQKLIADAYAAGEKEVLLPSGVHLVSYSGGEHIKLKGMSDFTIKGQDTVLVFDNNGGPGITINDCENLHFVGFDTDYKECGFYQGEIVAIDENGRYIDAWVDPAYPHHLLDSRFFYPTSNNARFFDFDNLPVRDIDSRGYIAGVDKIGQYRYRMYFSRSDIAEKLKVGYQLGGQGKAASAFQISSSGAMHLKDVNIYSGHLGVSECFTEGGSTYENVHIIPGPKKEGARYERMYSVYGTGFFMRSLRKGPKMDNISVVRNNDDGINIHSSYGRVAEQVDSKTVIIGMGGDETPFAVGDTVRFSTETNENDKSGNVMVAEAVIAEVEQLSDYTPAVDLTHDSGLTKFYANFFYRLTLDRDVTVEPRNLFEDATLAGNGMELRNSLFKETLPRAVMLHANNAIVENCQFIRVPRYAILMDPEVDWCENGYVHNTTISNCTFIECGYSTEGAAPIGLAGYDGMEHRNIVLEENLFYHNYRADIEASCVTNLTLRGNIFGEKNPLSVYEGGAVNLDKSDGVTLDWNYYTDESRKVVEGSLADGVVYTQNDGKGVLLTARNEDGLVAVDVVEEGTHRVPQADVVIGRPENAEILSTHTQADGFYERLYTTPWGFEHAPVGPDLYEDLTFIQSGWYHETYHNWLQGTVQHPISMHAGVLADPIVSFTAPRDGTIMIHESYCGDLGENYNGDGVQFKITKNSKNIYPKEGWVQVLDNDSNAIIPDLVFRVKKGDVIRFRLNCIANQVSDGVHWPKTISYLKTESGEVIPDRTVQILLWSDLGNIRPVAGAKTFLINP